MMVDRRFGDAGARLVIEECLVGPRGLVLRPVRRHPACRSVGRRITSARSTAIAGPNTGGMGAYAPSSLFDAATEARVMRRRSSRPVIDGMRAEGHEFRGFLFVGLMLTADGPKVIEFNVRFGDPEAQVVLPMIAGRLSPLLAAAAAGQLPDDRRVDSAPSRTSAW